MAFFSTGFRVAAASTFATKCSLGYFKFAFSAFDEGERLSMLPLTSA